MRVLLQRVASASVMVSGEVTGAIDEGLTLLAGVSDSDTITVVAQMTEKIANLRIFEDAEERMNLSALDRLSAGDEIGILVVSQFTLYGDVRKGRRPSFTRAAGGELASPLIEAFADQFRALGFHIGQGVFGAHMQVSLVNDGPVTIWIDSDELRRPRGGADV